LPQALCGSGPDTARGVGGGEERHWGPRARARARQVAVLCAGLLGVIWLGSGRREPLLQLRRTLGFTWEEAQSVNMEWGCGARHVEVDYKIPIVAAIPNVPSEAECIRHCVDNSACMAWTFGQAPGIAGFSNVCLLKALKQEDLPPPMGPRPGAVSGALPCHMEGEGILVSLFCFTMARESTNDHRMLQLQHREQVGCFACDSLSLYSNKTFEVAPGVWTIPIQGSLESRSGGEAGLPLSFEFAMRIWTDVARSGIYKDHDWTVKVAIDALFLPQRLRSILPHHRQENRGVYLNNCRFNLRGAIEVMSRIAADAWVQGVSACFQWSAEHCSGDCGWGDDVFLDQCMKQVLGARRDDEWRLLLEDDCPGKASAGQWSPDACRSDHVAFHPFRTPELLGQCLAIARNQPW